MADRPPRVPFGVAVLAAVMAGAFKLLALTWRMRVRNGAAYTKLLSTGQPFIYACWHGQLLPLLWHHRGCGAVLLISRSRDGDLIARVASHFGFRAVRGSSSRGATSALREPILCVGCDTPHAWHAGSWDRMMVPLPFARVTVAYSEPESPTGRTAADAALDAPRFGRLLDAATEEASRANNDALRASPHR